ncbi:MAG TPA: pyridoxamine 5'-phosphate oxidase [Acidimicrobiales bacterium]|nr:pyridoxamine 5'-phosphate oxidase [Acidimicrobiales bacterium]
MPDHSVPLLEADAATDPFDQFAAWYAEASQVARVPEAMAVASADVDGRPSVRMVLLKGWDSRGFVFFTHYGSRKGHELDSNPRAALLFHWDELGRQVRIEGVVERITPAESNDYFATRPLGAQIGAHASNQSQPIESRDVLDERVQRLRETYAGTAVPRPDTWGGYRLTAQVFEFWQNRDDRLHDRLRYTASGGAWRRERLQP